MITARSSVLNIKPGYYPQLSMVLNPILNPPGIPGDKVTRIPRPLLMTPKAIRHREYSRAWKAAHMQRKRAGLH